jgi:SAM-dependent methyltransferase
MSQGPKQPPPTPELGPDLYARWRASELGTITERLERALILDLVGDAGGREVLDLGCGDGDLALDLARRHANVTGLDASIAMIAAAGRWVKPHHPEVTFEVGSADRLPFAAERFDVVTAVTILCFVRDAAPVFREIVRVLRPGGRLVIGELGKWSWWAAERRLRAWLGSPLWRRGRFRTGRELRALAEGAGLIVENLRGAVYYPQCRLAARLLGPYDPLLSRVTTIGAGFVALSGRKPPSGHMTGGGPVRP